MFSNPYSAIDNNRLLNTAAFQREALAASNPAPNTCLLHRSAFSFSLRFAFFSAASSLHHTRFFRLLSFHRSLSTQSKSIKNEWSDVLLSARWKAHQTPYSRPDIEIESVFSSLAFCAVITSRALRALDGHEANKLCCRRTNGSQFAATSWSFDSRAIKGD